MSADNDEMEILEGQQCPICRANELTLTEKEMEIPYFGNVLLFSMTCNACRYHKSDVESLESSDPVKYTLEVTSEEDLRIRIVKSADATVKIPHIMTMEPGAASNGFVTNVEGLLNRVKYQIESARESEEDNDKKKKAKNMLKKLQKVFWGQEKLKIIIEDPTGNSAIISEKAVKGKL